MHRTIRRLAGLLALLPLAAAAPASAQSVATAESSAARAPVVVRAVGAIPSEPLAPGDRFTLKARVKNRGDRAKRPKLAVALRTSRSAKPIRVATKRLSRLKSKRARRSRVAVALPSDLAAGSYLVRVCAKVGKRTSCRYAKRLLKVRKPGTPLPTPGPGNGPKFEVLVFTGAAAPASYASGLAAIKAVAKSGGFRVTQSSNASIFTENGLKQYRAVVLLGNVGAPLNEAQEAALRRSTRTAAVCSRSAPRSSPSRTGAT